jgi:hypothetical protein
LRTFGEIAEMAAQSGLPIGSLGSQERWLADRLSQHAKADRVHIQALADGRWVQINELKTSEGGRLGIYTDVTEVKAEDARERARELAERNLALQTTLDTLSEGFATMASTGACWCVIRAWSACWVWTRGVASGWKAMMVCCPIAAIGWGWIRHPCWNGAKRASRWRAMRFGRAAFHHPFDPVGAGRHGVQLRRHYRAGSGPRRVARGGRNA